MKEIPKISRRNVLAGLAAAPLLASKSLANYAPFQEPLSEGSGQPSEGLPRYQGASAPLFGGLILVTGGYQVRPSSTLPFKTLPTANAQILNPATGEWTDVAPMRIARARHAAAFLWDGRVAVLGGFSDGPLDSIEVYDPRLNRWSTVGSLPFPMADISASAGSGRIIVTGGGNAFYSININQGLLNLP